jgi:hypothetical protein
MMSSNDEPPPTKKEYVLCESYNRWFSRTEYQSVREHIWFSTEFEGKFCNLQYFTFYGGIILGNACDVVNANSPAHFFSVRAAVLRSTHRSFLLCRPW